MALGAALKDQARYVRRVSAQRRVEGRTVTVATPSPWFRARLDLGQQPESGDPGGRTRVVASPSLMIGNRDLEGNSMTKPEGGCVISAEDRIEVVSVQLGTETWEVTGDPQPMRKKRTVLGWTVPLQRVDARTLSST